MYGSLRKRKIEKEKTPIRYFEGLNYKILISVVVSNIFFQLSEVSSSIFLYIGTMVMVAMLLIIDTGEYLYLSMAYLSVLRFATIFDVSVINIITVVYFIKAYFLDNEYRKEKYKRKMPKQVFLAGVVNILYCLQYMFRSDSLKTVFIAIKLLIFLVYLVDVFRCCTSKKELKDKLLKMQVYYIYGILVAIFTSLLINSEYSLGSNRMTLAEGTGANQLGIALAFCIVLVTLGVTKAGNVGEWITLILTALPLLYFCFATQSRTCIVVMIIAVVSTVFFGLQKKESRTWVALMVVGVIVVLGGLIVFAEGTRIHANIMETIERFINPRNGDLSNGRFEIWELYFSRLKSDAELFFLGGTMSDYTDAQAHNMFIEMFSSYGLFGFMIVVWIYGAVFYEIRKAIVKFGACKIRILGFLPLASVFITGMASHTLLNTEQTLYFCIGVAMIYLYGEDISDENSLVDSNETGRSIGSKRRRNKKLRRMDYRYGQKLRRIR